MRRLPLVSIALLSSLALFAQAAPGDGTPLSTPSFGIKSAAKAILTDLGDRKLSDLSGSELLGIEAKLALASREDAYVLRSSMLSFMLPGMGQFATKEPGAGAAFLLADLALVGGSLAGAWYLMPTDVRPDNLDYFGTPLSTIKAKWEAHTFNELLPLVGLSAATRFLDMHLRMFSAHSAGRAAEKLLQSGAVEFEPRLGPGFMGMKLKFK